MSYSFQGLFAPMPLRSVLGTALADPGLFYELGDALERPARIIKLDNLTDTSVLIAYNQGVEAFTIIPSGGFVLLDVTTNKTFSTEWLVNEGSQFWANAPVTPTNGSVYLTAIGSRDM